MVFSPKYWLEKNELNLWINKQNQRGKKIARRNQMKFHFIRHIWWTRGAKKFLEEKVGQVHKKNENTNENEIWTSENEQLDSNGYMTSSTYKTE